MAIKGELKRANENIDALLVDNVEIREELERVKAERDAFFRVAHSSTMLYIAASTVPLKEKMERIREDANSLIHKKPPYEEIICRLANLPNDGRESPVMKRKIETTITVTNDSWRKTQHVAEQIAESLGYVVGPMQREEPRAMFLKIDGTDVVVAKWRNLSLTEREHADGVMVMDAGHCEIEIRIREPQAS